LAAVTPVCTKASEVRLLCRAKEIETRKSKFAFGAVARGTERRSGVFTHKNAVKTS
jgi:hypothetical protein